MPRRPKDDVAHHRCVPPSTTLGGWHLVIVEAVGDRAGNAPRACWRAIRRTTVCGTVGGRPSLTPLARFAVLGPSRFGPSRLQSPSLSVACTGSRTAPRTEHWKRSV